MSYHQFSIVQGRAVEDRRIDNDVYRLLAAIGMYADKDGWCWPAQETLAQNVGKDRTWVNKKIKTLVALGYLQSAQRYGKNGSKMSNKYRLLYDEPTPCAESREDNHIPCDEGRVDFHSNDPLNDPINTSVIVIPETLPIDWQIAAGNKISSLPDNQETQMRYAAELLAMTFGASDRDKAFYIAYTFMKTRGIIIPQSKIKGQRKAVKEMIEMKVNAASVEKAVNQLLAKNMTVSDLYSVMKTAISIANPAPGKYDPNSKFEQPKTDEEFIE